MLNVSGCLMPHGDYFVQLLERAREDVLEIYTKIEQDYRHSEVTLLCDGSVRERYFSGWNMSFNRPENENVK